MHTHLVDLPVPLNRFEVRGEIYRSLRVRGITIRSSNDCLIAAIAILNRRSSCCTPIATSITSREITNLQARNSHPFRITFVITSL